MNHGIALNDFYEISGVKHGNIHAHPVNMTAESVAAYLSMKYPRRVQQMPRIAKLVAWIGAKMHAEKTHFFSVVEDLPCADNSVVPTPSVSDHITYKYTVRDELRRRAQTLVRSFAERVRSHYSVSIFGDVCQLNRSHACGTLRFGDDPRSSVLDRTNRAHEVDNLYAVDSSFFPSSGGINPSLTIAANALRVAEIIATRL